MDYAPNSHKAKEEKAQTEAPERKKLEKVVTGKVKTKKRNEMSKLGEIFIAEDARNVKSYILMDVLVPAVKKAISDIVTNGIDMLLFGEGGRTRKTSSASTVSYRNYYDQKDTRRDYSNTRTRTGYSYDDIILETRGEAEEVLARMDELIETYGIVSVADLYDLVGKTCNYTDNKYGWTNIRNAEPIRVRDGYMLKMPKAGPI
jgi:hypothetical protein|nr:MAG TPA: hypothetical protein [Caudoviricetes sp.]